MRKKTNLSILIIFLILLVIVSIVASMCLGAVRIPLSKTVALISCLLTGGDLHELDLYSTYQIIWNLRLPRIILALVAGIGLSLSGTVMQASVQNPMADPYIIGISAGATLGATFSIFIGAGVISSLSAFLGSAFACFTVLGLASKGGKATPVKLILSGMVINALFTAFSNFIISISGDSDGIMTIKFWTMGSLARASWSNILLPSLIVLLGFVFFLTQYRVLNLMLIGEDAASTLGVNTPRFRVIYLLVISAITGILVSSTGTIGFLGLAVPHVCRSLTGTDHRRLVPVASLAGGVALIWMDAIARSMLSNAELPVGIFTALLGTPVFVYILIKRNYGFSS